LLLPFCLQDSALDFDIFGDSFETSVPWDKCLTLCENVKEAVREAYKELDVTHFLVGCRVTQTYDAGACVYFYSAFHDPSEENPTAIFKEVENKARDEILASGL